MGKEETWLKNRVGRITASELGDIMSASGKIIDGNVTYIRCKRWERLHGYALPVSARAMDIGNETEPMIFEWLKANLGGENVVYSKDPELGEIPFWVPDDAQYFGASPDAFTFDHETVYEFKTLVGNEATFFFMDEYTPYEEKKARVLKEHGDQLMGLFLSNPKVQRIIVIKYAPQRDDIMADTDSPLAPWRGITFTFERKDYEVSIAETMQRIMLFNAMIDARVNPVDFKSGSWVLKDGKLYKRPEEPKKK
jgi:hypothetical protein